MENELLDGIRGFEPWEANYVARDFVCAVCWSSLIAIQLESDRTMIVVCPEHGNVELCGRITKNTVSIELENGFRRYHDVIRNLPDLWGQLQNEGFDYAQAHKLARTHVCKKCGRDLYEELILGDRDHVNLVCITHGNVNQCGYIEKGKYHANRRVN